MLALRLRVPDLLSLPSARERVEPVLVGAARVLARLDQGDRRDVGQPGPFRGELGQGDHAALHLGVADLLPVRVRLVADAQAVVVHHPGAPERPRQRLPLSWRGIEAVPVPDLHGARAYQWPMTIPGLLPWRRGGCTPILKVVKIIFWVWLVGRHLSGCGSRARS